MQDYNQPIQHKEAGGSVYFHEHKQQQEIAKQKNGHINCTFVERQPNGFPVQNGSCGALQQVHM